MNPPNSLQILKSCLRNAQHILKTNPHIVPVEVWVSLWDTSPALRKHEWMNWLDFWDTDLDSSKIGLVLVFEQKVVDLIWCFFRQRPEKCCGRLAPAGFAKQKCPPIAKNDLSQPQSVTQNRMFTLICWQPAGFGFGAQRSILAGPSCEGPNSMVSRDFWGLSVRVSKRTQWFFVFVQICSKRCDRWQHAWKLRNLN